MQKLAELSLPSASLLKSGYEVELPCASLVEFVAVRLSGVQQSDMEPCRLHVVGKRGDQHMEECEFSDDGAVKRPYGDEGTWAWCPEVAVRTDVVVISAPVCRSVSHVTLWIEHQESNHAYPLDDDVTAHIVVEGLALDADPGGSDALRLFNITMRLEKSEPTVPVLRDSAEAYLLCGVALTNGRKFVQAAELFRKAQEVCDRCNPEPSFLRAYHCQVELLAAEALRQQGRVKHALQAYRSGVVAHYEASDPRCPVIPPFDERADVVSALMQLNPHLIDVLLLCLAEPIKRMNSIQLAALRGLEFVLDSLGCSIGHGLCRLVDALLEILPQLSDYEEGDVGVVATCCFRLLGNCYDLAPYLSGDLLSILLSSILIPCLETNPGADIKATVLRFVALIFARLKSRIVSSSAVLSTVWVCVNTPDATVRLPAKKAWHMLCHALIGCMQVQDAPPLLLWIATTLTPQEEEVEKRSSTRAWTSDVQQREGVALLVDLAQAVAERTADLSGIHADARAHGVEEQMLHAREAVLKSLSIIFHQMCWASCEPPSSRNDVSLASVWACIEAQCLLVPGVDANVSPIVRPLLCTMQAYCEDMPPTASMMRILLIALRSLRPDTELRFECLDLLCVHLQWVPHSLADEAFELLDVLLDLCSRELKGNLVTLVLEALIDQYTVKGRARLNSLRHAAELFMAPPTGPSYLELILEVCLFSNALPQACVNDTPIDFKILAALHETFAEKMAFLHLCVSGIRASHAPALFEHVLPVCTCLKEILLSAPNAKVRSTVFSVARVLIERLVATLVLDTATTSLWSSVLESSSGFNTNGNYSVEEYIEMLRHKLRSSVLPLLMQMLKMNMDEDLQLQSVRLLLACMCPADQHKLADVNRDSPGASSDSDAGHSAPSHLAAIDSRRKGHAFLWGEHMRACGLLAQSHEWLATLAQAWDVMLPLLDNPWRNLRLLAAGFLCCGAYVLSFVPAKARRDPMCEHPVVELCARVIATCAVLLHSTDPDVRLEGLRILATFCGQSRGDINEGLGEALRVNLGITGRIRVLCDDWCEHTRALARNLFEALSPESREDAWAAESTSDVLDDSRVSSVRPHLRAPFSRDHHDRFFPQALWEVPASDASERFPFRTYFRLAEFPEDVDSGTFAARLERGLGRRERKEDVDDADLDIFESLGIIDLEEGDDDLRGRERSDTRDNGSLVMERWPGARDRLARAAPRMSPPLPLIPLELDDGTDSILEAAKPLDAGSPPGAEWTDQPDDRSSRPQSKRPSSARLRQRRRPKTAGHTDYYKGRSPFHETTSDDSSSEDLEFLYIEGVYEGGADDLVTSEGNSALGVMTDEGFVPRPDTPSPGGGIL